ncbi:MAG: PstS family phosphate ABC transporter substrate-binding protein [SAR202 cluster bacterium]|nr:MAG: PstS family phosphate ABC transporter substrate-binding protein [SAR202 cluster bacterium]
MLNTQVFLCRTRALAFAVVFATALILIACGSSDSDTGSKQLSGDIIIDGSSTVFPITEAVAEEFGILTGGKTRITVGISGTGGGFKKICAGETHIQDASRPVKQSEIDLCADSGREFVELPVAIDGLSVIVHPTNDFVDCLTIDELHTLWSPEAEGKITRWNQVRDSFPDESVNLYGPGVNSGTFDYFTETVNGEAQASRGDFLASEDDNVLVHSVSNDANGLGYFGYAYYTANAAKLKIVPIDGGDGCIEPTDETINNGTYAPLSRPLLIYIEKNALEQEQVLEFIRYFLGNEARGLISEVGFIPYQDNVYQLAKNKVESRIVGAVFGGDNRLTGTVEEILAASSGE